MTQNRQVALERIRSIARLWDEAFRLPGLGWRFGLDAIVGLLPGIGDLVGVAVSGYLIVEAARLGARGSVLVRMIANVAIDAAIGAVPLLGDLFDAGWKANRRNRELLERWLVEPNRVERSSALAVGAVIVAMVGVLGLTGWLIVAAIGALLG